MFPALALVMPAFEWEYCPPFLQAYQLKTFFLFNIFINILQLIKNVNIVESIINQIT